jgi:hypothetical protein
LGATWVVSIDDSVTLTTKLPQLRRRLRIRKIAGERDGVGSGSF